MARKKITKDEKEWLQSPEAVPYVLEFARNLESGLYGNVFTPMTTNSRMKDLSLNNQVVESESLERALENPKNSEDKLISYSQQLEIQTMAYKRMVYYLSRQLSFNLDVICIDENVDYGSKQYLKDRSKVREFFDKFDYVFEFQNILDALVKEESYYCSFRDDIPVKYGIQELPAPYSLITGRNPLTTLNFDFNFSYFMNSGIDINLFAPSMKRYFYEIFGEGALNNKYLPSASLNSRDGIFATWRQVSPEDGFYCFKLFPQSATRIPFFAALFPDFLLMPLYRTIAKNSYYQSSLKLLLSQVPFNKDQKGANLANSFSVDAQNLGRFLQLVRSSIDPAISVATAPLEEFQGISFDAPNKNPQNENLFAVGAQSGINSRTLFTVDKQNITETIESLNNDANLISSVYVQFERFLNYYVNRGLKHKFKFMLSGINSHTAKEKLKKDAIDLTNMGIFISSKVGHAFGYNSPFAFERLLAENKFNNWDEKLPKIIPPAQVAKETEDSGGRPQKDSSELSESGSEGRDAGSNLSRGGEV